MGKKTMDHKKTPPKKDTEGSPQTAEPPVTNPRPAVELVAPTAPVPPQPAAIAARITPQVASQPSIHVSQVMDFLKILYPRIDWGMAMVAMGVISQNPTVPTVPSTATVSTSKITSPAPEPENLNQQEPPSNDPETSAPEKEDNPQQALDVNPISIYEPISATEERVDESEKEEEGVHEEEKGEGAEEIDSENEGLKSSEKLEGKEEEMAENREDREENLGNENEERKNAKDSRDDNASEEEAMRVVRYSIGSASKCESWESAIAVPATTPQIKIKRRFVAGANSQVQKEKAHGEL